MANPTSNFGWQMPQNTDLVKDLPADFEVFGQAVDTSLMDLKGGTTGQVLSKASNTDMDFTWVAVDPLTILDAKGDLISATAADTPARLAVGTNGQVLTADSTQSTGLAWTTPSSGGMTLISETVANANSSITFSSIPGTYKQLRLYWSGLQCDQNTSDFSIRLNNDSTAGIYKGAVFGGDAGYLASTSYTRNHLGYRSMINKDYISSTLEVDSKGWLEIDNYASTTKLKLTNSVYYHYDGNSGWQTLQQSTIYNSTSAITSIDIVRLSGAGTLSNATNTSIRLYGVS